jgi:hypothetical protein
MIGVEHEPRVDTDEPDRRLNRRHDNGRKFGTLFKTVSAACLVEMALYRGAPPWRPPQPEGETPHVQA